MTEREKRIEEMVRDVCFDYTPNCCGCSHSPLCSIRRHCGYLHDAGYRKADEARKETIIQVAKWLNGLADNDLIYLLLRKFGVEVEE